MEKRLCAVRQLTPSLTARSLVLPLPLKFADPSRTCCESPHGTQSFFVSWFTDNLLMMQIEGMADPEESKDSSSRNLYAAHIVRQGLNKEGWKLVVTGAAITIVM